MLVATSINEVIGHLDHIIDICKQQQNRMGYFACLYRKMTIAVKEGIAKNAFEDGARMERLDVLFANRYLHAWFAFTNKQPCTNAWCAAFNAAAGNNLIVLQHLFLGINTHINLDLGIAAAQTCPGNGIYNLEQDFNKINNVISSLMQQVQEDLSAVWPPLRLLAGIANHQQDVVLNFSIGAARKASWANAVALSAMPDCAVKDAYIHGMDNTVCVLANRIINPGFAMRLLLQPVLKTENRSVADIIGMLRD